VQTREIANEIRTYIITHHLSGRAERLRSDGLLLGDVIDSTGVIELISYVQERFEITVEDEEITPENLASIEVLAAFIETKIQSGKQKHCPEKLIRRPDYE